MSRYLVISCYQQDVTQLLVLEVGLHFTERLLCMICGLEKFVGGVGGHSGQIAQNQPGENETETRQTFITPDLLVFFFLKLG